MCNLKRTFEGLLIIQPRQLFQLDNKHNNFSNLSVNTSYDISLHKKYTVSVKLHGNRLTLQRWILISSEMKSYTKVKAPNDCEPT